MSPETEWGRMWGLSGDAKLWVLLGGRPGLELKRKEHKVGFNQLHWIRVWSETIVCRTKEIRCIKGKGTWIPSFIHFNIWILLFVPAQRERKNKNDQTSLMNRRIQFHVWIERGHSLGGLKLQDDHQVNSLKGVRYTAVCIFPAIRSHCGIIFHFHDQPIFAHILLIQ